MNAPDLPFTVAPPYPELHARLLAVGPHSPARLALAGTMALAAQRRGRWRAPIAGLATDDFVRLVTQCFPAAADWLPQLHALRREGEAVPADRCDEFSDLVALLAEHAAHPDEASRWLGHAIATACMADNHLWQDLGLPDRAMLGRLMSEEFPGLRALNAGDMKWKKFFYRQLCLRADVLICKAPSCAVCSDRPLCFAPED